MTVDDERKELVKRLREPYRVGKGNFDAMVSEAARAAIAAVAEWIDEHHQIDKDGSVHCALTWQYTASHVAPTTPEVK